MFLICFRWPGFRTRYEYGKKWGWGGGAGWGANRFRSEERRVGEEGRFRGWPDHLKKKKEQSRPSTTKLPTSDQLTWSVPQSFTIVSPDWPSFFFPLSCPLDLRTREPQVAPTVTVTSV